VVKGGVVSVVGGMDAIAQWQVDPLPHPPQSYLSLFAFLWVDLPSTFVSIDG